MGEAGPDRDRPVGEREADVEHLRHEVAVGEPAATERPAAGEVEPDPDVADVRLQPYGVLDRPREAPRRARADGDPEVLVEHPAELDPGLEQQRFAAGDPRGVHGALGHGRSPGVDRRATDGERPGDIVERDADEEPVRADLGGDGR